ncbi:tRNA pseudouridine(55) synthase TruB [Cryptosporangium sp. NPDC051539]|uniref:tRNA pseudouridine(55) synthase TruB n=1 Tax=Cryptosporangium sp. NPDC051539 TaxID=3363962 RepID=UPI0037948760
MNAVTSGLVVVDKPSGLTSHDVVARARRIFRTRKIGHAGTLDPMATGVLVLGVERATKLLGHLTLTEKTYVATIRLGYATVTDDAEGARLDGASASGVHPDDVRAGLKDLTGTLDQVPSAVSAVKVAGRRAYDRVRSGEEVELAARQVTVSRFDLLADRRPEPDLLDLDVIVECSSGTYVRALARDLGRALGTGGHLTALRRTRVGPFPISAARTLEQLAEEEDPVTLDLDAAVATAFPRRDVDEAAATVLGHGGRLPATGVTGVYGVFGPDGKVIALVREQDGAARSEVVLRPSG